MLSKDGLKNHIDSKPSGKGLFFGGEDILNNTKNLHESEESEKNNQVFVSHKEIIDSIHK